MKVLGIIAEYNPFHFGHLYHLRESKEITGATHAIAVMSGNFVQRGEPAITDKWTRAQMAVNNGIDLVLELPFVFATSSAEYFGEAGVGLLESLGIVDFVSYGSETGSANQIEKAAEFLAEENEDFKKRLKNNLAQGLPFPSAREKAMSEAIPGLGEVLRHSNNILAVEYVKAAKRIGSKMNFVAVKRLGSNFNESSPDELSFSSATAIRKEIYMGGLKKARDLIPQESLDVFKSSRMHGLSYPRKEDLFNCLQFKLRMAGHEELELIEGMREGLENRLKAAAYKSLDYDSLIGNVESKRYPRSSIQRLLLHLLAGLKKSELNEFRNAGAYYARVLGMNEKGKSLIREIKKKSDIAIITNVNRQKPEEKLLERMMEYDLKATDLYMLLMMFKGCGFAGSQDKLTDPYIENKEKSE